MRLRTLQTRRRASAYIVIIGIAMLVTVMGMGGLLSTRLAGAKASNSADWEEAGVLAQAAVEQGLSYLNAQVAANPTGWRSNFNSFVHGGTPAFSASMGRGTFSWEVVDTVDASFAANYQAPFKLYGIGTVNRATRCFSVMVTAGGAPLDLLRCGLQSGGNLSTSGSVVLGAGPVSCNAQANTGAQIYGSVETNNQSGPSNNVTGAITTGLVKTMPAAAVFNLYNTLATPFTTSFTTGGTIGTCLLTSTSNPYGPTNINGVYSVNVSAGSKTLTINSCRIIGTLVITLGNKATLNLVGPILWEPARPDYPLCIVQCTSNNATINIQGSTSWLSEASVGLDLNGNGTMTDDLPPQYRGMIHIIGSGNAVQISNNAYVHGIVVADGAVSTSGTCALISDPNLYSHPPIGYGTGSQLIPAPGTWLWDSPP
jgi:hypothetical protein